jgi:ribonucleotide monophosphatase NagD (HAD superfamily)
VQEKLQKYLKTSEEKLFILENLIDEIYEMCFKKSEKVLAIGDNLNTDIRGANNMNIDSIFISNGVHRSEFKDEIELINLQSKYKVKANYYQTQLTW